MAAHRLLFTIEDPGSTGKSPEVVSDACDFQDRAAGRQASHEHGEAAPLVVGLVDGPDHICILDARLFEQFPDAFSLDGLAHVLSIRPFFDSSFMIP